MGAPWGHVATVHISILTVIHLFWLEMLNTSEISSWGGLTGSFNACSQKLQGHCTVHVPPPFFHSTAELSLQSADTGKPLLLCHSSPFPTPHPPCFPEFNLSPTSVSYECIFVESPKSLDAVGEAVCLCLPHGDAVRSQCLRSWATPRGDCEGRMD